MSDLATQSLIATQIARALYAMAVEQAGGRAYTARAGALGALVMMIALDPQPESALALAISSLQEAGPLLSVFRAQAIADIAGAGTAPGGQSS